MTGTPEHQGDPAPEPPLPGPVDETQPPMTIIGGPAAQDSPQWSPDERVADAPAQRRPDMVSGSSGGPVGSSGGTTISGFFSNLRRTGRWDCPPKLTLNGAFSDVQLDFREAVITSPEVELTVYDAFNSCKIIVPPGVGVDLAGGTSIMSSEKSQADSVVAPGAYRLRILRYGFCSDLKILVLAPGEDEPKWWKRSG